MIPGDAICDEAFKEDELEIGFETAGVHIAFVSHDVVVVAVVVLLLSTRGVDDIIPFHVLALPLQPWHAYRFGRGPDVEV